MNDINEYLLSIHRPIDASEYRLIKSAIPVDRWQIPQKVVIPTIQF